MLCRYASSLTSQCVPLLRNDSAAATSQVVMCPCGALSKFRDLLTPAPPKIQCVFRGQNIAICLCELSLFCVQLTKEHAVTSSCILRK